MNLKTKLFLSKNLSLFQEQQENFSAFTLLILIIFLDWDYHGLKWFIFEIGKQPLILHIPL